jgi:flagellar protein FlaG
MEKIMVSETQLSGASKSAMTMPVKVALNDHRVESQAPQVPKAHADLAVPKSTNIKYDANQLKESLKDAVKILNEQITSKSQGLGFSYDEKLNKPVITVTNTASGQVVRQIPNMEVLKLAHKLDDLKGILYNAKV